MQRLKLVCIVSESIYELENISVQVDSVPRHFLFAQLLSQKEQKLHAVELARSEALVSQFLDLLHELAYFLSRECTNFLVLAR